jgi:CBS domain containing-hemolysin-like protein
VAEGTEEIVERALDFSSFAAHHVMVPRTEIIAVPHDVPLARLVAIVHQYQHSRYPVFDGNVDNVIGVLSAKRLLGPVVSTGEDEFRLRDHIAVPLFVPESLPAYQVLAQMKRHRAHMAIVIDEYGVTAGLVTLRDLIGRIAGELPDETESASPAIAWLDDGSALVGGLTLLSDIEHQLGVQFVETEVDTLGGLIFDWLGRRPAVGDSMTVQGYLFTVEEMDGLRIAQVRLRRAQDADADPRGAVPPAFIARGPGR